MLTLDSLSLFLLTHKENPFSNLAFACAVVFFSGVFLFAGVFAMTQSWKNRLTMVENDLQSKRESENEETGRDISNAFLKEFAAFTVSVVIIYSLAVNSIVSVVSIFVGVKYGNFALVDFGHVVIFGKFLVGFAYAPTLLFAVARFPFNAPMQGMPSVHVQWASDAESHKKCDG